VKKPAGGTISARSTTVAATIEQNSDSQITLRAWA
jgi:hypothetical protein